MRQRLTYEKAEEYLRSGRDPDDRPLQNNTRLQRLGSGDIAVVLHDTDVVTLHEDGSFTLDSGGWYTQTTKDRLNTYAPFGYVRQENGVWYWEYDGDSINFEDGMTVHPDGTVSGARSDEEVSELEALGARINEFSRDFADALASGDVPEPSGGDCWMCLMFDEEAGFSRTDHLYSHLEENYFVPSLLINALEFYGASQATYSGLGYIWGKHDQEYWSRHVDDAAYRALRKYLRHRLGLAS